MDEYWKETCEWEDCEEKSKCIRTGPLGNTVCVCFKHDNALDKIPSANPFTSALTSPAALGMPDGEWN